jgi:F-type H+-transporting ATPase subunit gamma
MPSTRDIRRRIKSVKNTSQITRAMQMVSATKMRKAQNQALSGRPYWQALIYALAQVSGQVNPEIHPLLSSNNSAKVGMLVITTDKGLCGSLNANIVRMLANQKMEGEAVYYTTGRKGRDFIVRSGKKLEADFARPEHVSFKEAVSIRKLIMEAFLKGEVGKVYMVYPHFLSTLRQEPKMVQILPIEKPLLEEVLNNVPGEKQALNSLASEFMFEPGADQVLDYALVHLLDTRIYQALLESKASEHSATMIAMQNATENAKELVQDLQLTYNQMRQGAITTELLEITSAAAALE